jgi:dihydroorotase-like cyclic amidohydrolase
MNAATKGRKGAELAEIGGLIDGGAVAFTDDDNPVVSAEIMRRALEYCRMFDKPVLLSSWLAAQENTTCSADAKVTSYSIQSGSAYTPANGMGTAFMTDPNYTATNQTLVNYQNLTTCP